jgi:hypothetical protein
MKLLFTIFLSVTSVLIFAQPYTQWNGLQPGPYNVGFKTYNCYDYGRHVQPKLDFEGNKNDGETVQQIAVYVWYPCCSR